MTKSNEMESTVLTELLYRLEKETHTGQPDPEAHEMTRAVLKSALEKKPLALAAIGLMPEGSGREAFEDIRQSLQSLDK